MPKIKRVVLGVGYPWFSGNDVRIRQSVKLYLKPLDEANKSKDYRTINLDIGEVGNWNKVCLVVEILE